MSSQHRFQRFTLCLMVAVLATCAERGLAAASDIQPSARLPVPRLPNPVASRGVAIDGDTAVVATDLPGFSGSGVRVFRRTHEGWRQEALLAPAAGSSGPGGGAGTFGAAIAISGGTIVVGSPPAGAIVFVRGAEGWRQQAILKPVLEPGIASFAGAAVAISGDRLLIGGPSNAPHEQNAGGAAFAFVRAGESWRQDATLFDVHDNFFGGRVALAGNLAAISGSGRVDLYLHGRGAWHARASVPNIFLAFVLSGTTLVLDLFRDVPVEIEVFRGGTVLSEAEIEAGLVVSAALHGDTLVLGLDSGPALVFTRRAGTWQQTATLAPPPAAPNQGFGRAVAISGQTAVVAADRDVWVFKLPRDNP
jgi:hypothetical protein